MFSSPGGLGWLRPFRDPAGESGIVGRFILSLVYNYVVHRHFQVQLSYDTGMAPKMIKQFKSNLNPSC